MAKDTRSRHPDWPERSVAGYISRVLKMPLGTVRRYIADPKEKQG